MRRAFTLIELIVVISILTFVGLFGLTQISSIYEAYITQKIADTLETDAKNAINQIALRIANGIKESVVVLDNSYSCVKPVSENSGNISSIAWVGGDKELFMGLWNGSYNSPAVSGFADLNMSTYNQIVSYGSNATYANKIISSLSNKPSPLNQSNFLALYFGKNEQNSCDAFFGTSGAMIGVSLFNGYTLNLSRSANFISQYYKASWSAYAIEYVLAEKSLYLKYDFRPWLGENANSAKSSLLVQNVSDFGIKSENGLLRLNLCLEKNAGGFMAKICKERAIF
ncbi:MAG: hypothetical protein RL154_457 [Pseudomonadota bacterium]|jgi:prepilin-type N-terminal cleavage/methylation domain-containing protein